MAFLPESTRESWCVPIQLQESRDAVFRIPAWLAERAARFFGESFDGVEVQLHAGLTRLGCAAAACGDRLYFAPGQYDPTTSSGVRRILHELTHVVQQRRGRVTRFTMPGLVLLRDAALEREADRMAQMAASCQVGPMAGQRPGGPIHEPRHVLQPEVTVTIGGSRRLFGGGFFQKGYRSLWTQLQQLPRATELSPDLAERVERKLRHWVNAPAKATFSGKGHAKEFGSLQDLLAALIGRVSDSESKAYENQLAARIQASGTIHFLVHQFIRLALKPKHDEWMQGPMRAILTADGSGAGRYSYFYSRRISGVFKCAQRSLHEGLNYILEKEPPVAVAAAFLADYAYKGKYSRPRAANGAHGAPPRERPSLMNAVETSTYTPQTPRSSARLNHFNVNEQDEWVKRARTAGIRLGAGPSATTSLVLGLSQFLMKDWNEDQMRRNLMWIGLSLFAFWNMERKTLQMFSEIHTYHEVMLVLFDMGIPVVAALSGKDLAQAEFEYPELNDIPG